MTGLARYDAACRAIAEAKAIDEAKNIADKAEALRAYAHQARNRELEIDAAEIRIRAERRLGELIGAHKATVGLHEGGRPKTGSVAEPVSKPKLAEIGIDKKLSARAQKMAAVPESDFEAMIANWRGRIETENERVTTRLLTADAKARSRQEREVALGARIRAEAERLGAKRYGLIYADPPWRFEPYSRTTGMDRAADNHYPTMTLAEMAALTVPAADDCVLALWATVPMLPEALALMVAWDFNYKSHHVWNKDKTGTGYWNRNKHELLLLGTRGKIPAPVPGTQFDSVIDAPVGKHSEKPDRFRAMLETMFPSLPRIELFARGAHPGWDVWGAEADMQAAPTAAEASACSAQGDSGDYPDIPAFLKRKGAAT